MADNLKEQIEKELAQLRTALEASKKGQDQEPDDPEWPTMIQCYGEAVEALERLQAIANEPWQGITVVLEGGLVQCVVSKDTNMVGKGYDVIDYDTDGADEPGQVRQSDGSVSEACIGGGYIGLQTVEILIDDEENADAL